MFRCCGERNEWHLAWHWQAANGPRFRFKETTDSALPNEIRQPRSSCRARCCLIGQLSLGRNAQASEINKSRWLALQGNPQYGRGLDAHQTAVQSSNRFQGIWAGVSGFLGADRDQGRIKDLVSSHHFNSWGPFMYFCIRCCCC